MSEDTKIESAGAHLVPVTGLRWAITGTRARQLETDNREDR